MKNFFIALTTLFLTTLSAKAQIMEIYKGEELVAIYTEEQADKVLFKDATSNPLIGTKWIGEDGRYLHFKTLTTGVYYNGENYDKGDPYEDFTYTFSAKDNAILILFGDEYERFQYTDDCIVKGNRSYYKESTGTYDIVGRWKYSFYDDDSGFCLMTFRNDGTGIYFEYDDGIIDANNEPFYYIYNKEKKQLKIMWLRDDGSIGYVEDCNLIWFNEKTFMADHLMDRNSIWIKQ